VWIIKLFGPVQLLREKDETVTYLWFRGFI